MLISVWKTAIGGSVGRGAALARLVSVIALLVLVPVAARAISPSQASVVAGSDNVPMYINYQGYLTDMGGNAVSDTVPLILGLYPDSSGGSPFLTRVLTNVIIDKGVFSLKVGLYPADTTYFVGGLRRWIQLTVDGHVLLPRTEMTTMAYGLKSLYSDNSDMVDSRHANQFIWNGTTTQTSANFRIDGSGRANEQLVANATGLTGSSAVVGDVTGDNTALYGNAVNGTAVYGNSTHGHAVMGVTSDSTRFGAWGMSNSSRGTGVAGSGAHDTLYYLTCGSGGTFSARHIGLFAYGHDTTGTGIATMGNRIKDTVYTLASGSGGAFNGTTVGIYGLARNPSGDRAGGFFRTFGGPGVDTTWAYVAYNYGGQKYKIMGDGQNSTVMGTQDGARILVSPESPEAVFEDYGSARLVGGHCRVNLDPMFSDCIAVTDAQPLRVFITLNDDCRGIYVKSDANGFDAYEIGGGTSSAAFTYRVVGSRRGSAGVRFPSAPPPPVNVKTYVGSSSVPPAPVR